MDLAERNSRRIDLLVTEFEKLVNLIEGQLLIEPSTIRDIRKDLNAIRHSDQLRT
jgi:hypothetical protein